MTAGLINRRQTPRYPDPEVHGVLAARVAPDLDVSLLDVSAGGALIESWHRLVPGGRAILDLTTRDGQKAVDCRVLRCTVVNMRSNALCYRIAVKFCSLDPLKLAALHTTPAVTELETEGPATRDLEPQMPEVAPAPQAASPEETAALAAASQELSEAEERLDAVRAAVRDSAVRMEAIERSCFEIERWREILGEDRVAMQELIDRAAELRTPELNDKMDAILGRITLVETLERRVAALDALDTEFERRVTDTERKITEQRGRAAEIDALSSACGSLAVQVANAQAKLEALTTLTTHAPDLDDLDEKVGAVLSKIALVERLERRLAGLDALDRDVDRRIGETERKLTEQRRRAADLDAMSSACDGLAVRVAGAQGELDALTVTLSTRARGLDDLDEKMNAILGKIALVETLERRVARLDALDAEVGRKVGETERKITEQRGHLAQFEAIRSVGDNLAAQVAHTQSQLDGLTVTLSTRAPELDDLDEKMDAILSRIALVDGVQRRMADFDRLSAEMDRKIAETDRKLRDQRGYAADLDAIKSACDNLAAQMEDLQRRLDESGSLQSEVAGPAVEHNRFRPELPVVNVLKAHPFLGSGSARAARWGARSASRPTSSADVRQARVHRCERLSFAG